MNSRYLLIPFLAAVLSACGHKGGCDNIASEPMPPLLSETGCVNMNDPAQPVAGAIPYDINEPFWSDGAEKQRYLALPEDTHIDINAEGDFIFPVGTVLIKNFSLKGQLIETRFFIHSRADEWKGYSYEWNDARTEAQLLRNANERAIGDQVWHFPGRDECLKCHTAAAGFSLGLEIAQLNKDYAYASAGNPVNQLDYLQSLGMLKDVPPAMRNLKLANSKDPAHNLNERARAYLHSNCSHCHRPDGGTQSPMDLRAGIALNDTKACKVQPILGDLGIAGVSLLAPGDHARSAVWSRMHNPDNNRMPPWFNKVVDVHGVQLVEQWIDSLTGCN